MKNKRPSMKDIASKLNVSITTVSFVLNGKAKEKRISEGVTKKILDYIEKVDYQPNTFAQGLRTGKSGVIVVMLEDIQSRLARVIEDYAYKKGFKVLFCSNDNDDQKSIDLIKMFGERQADGFIIVPSPGIQEDIRNLIDAGVPVVLFDRYFPDLPTSYVVVDNCNAAYGTTRHLMENGFKKIAFITTDVDQIQMKERLRGYRKALEEQNYLEKVLKIPYQRNKVSIQNYIKLFLEDNPDIDAFFFATNYLTRNGLVVMRDNFPEFLTARGVASFDDEDLFRLLTPSVTAIAQPLEAIGEKLIDIMIEIQNDQNDKTRNIENQVVLQTNLVIRESSMALRS